MPRWIISSEARLLMSSPLKVSSMKAAQQPLKTVLEKLGTALVIKLSYGPFYDNEWSSTQPPSLKIGALFMLKSLY